MCHSAPQDLRSRCWRIDVIDEDDDGDDDGNHENEEPSLQTGEKPDGFERAKLFMHLVVKLSLKNLRHFTDSDLSSSMIRIKESGAVFTLGDPDGLGRGDLPIGLEHLILGGITEAQECVLGRQPPPWLSYPDLELSVSQGLRTIAGGP